MSSNDSSLYGFLKKGSVFSPNKQSNRRRSRSRSRDSRQQQNQNQSQKFNNPNIMEQPKNNPIFNNNYNQNTSDNFQRNLNIPNNNVPVINNSNNNPSYKNNNYQNINNPINNFTNNSNPIPNTNNNFQYHQQPFDTPVQRLKLQAEDNISQVSQTSQNTLWTGILSYSTSFQSARVESSQCLENLSMKITRQISSINSKIDLFNSRMAAVLGNQFRSIKEKIQQVFEAAFKESDKYIQDYMKQKEAALAGQLIKMKATLEKELIKIDGMKVELGKPQWRKVAGQILSTELEHHVEEIIQKSNTLEVGKWQLGDITGYRIKNIQAQIKEVVRLKA